MYRLQGHVPRVLVFGSGLENLPFVRTLMWEPASPYRPIGLCPGKGGAYAVHNAVLMELYMFNTYNQPNIHRCWQWCMHPAQKYTCQPDHSLYCNPVSRNLNQQASRIKLFMCASVTLSCVVSFLSAVLRERLLPWGEGYV